ncbi:MAG: ORF6N domain-containing protein [Spirochaetales bacterium]|nr:ORF6N domain-containing protein [Spirochaetales bacterium]
MSEERTNNLEITEEVLKTKILIIRGQQVMLDSDLAEIYGYTTKAFNQQVRNNLGKFDDDFRFQLTWDVICTPAG